MTMDALFAYGTLLFPEILQAVTGRVAASSPAALDGFVRRSLAGDFFPAVVEGAAGDRVIGVVYRGLDQRDWERLDRFEGSLYDRRAVTVRLGPAGPEGTAGSDLHAAFTYVLRQDSSHRLATEPWDPAAFARDHLAAFVARLVQATQPRARPD
jgi:gamma-glutamylcyclotransferase (GGCT)/AIG2-like uncharacterized protein YtfP